MSLGGEAIDAYGVIDEFPGKSMLTGLFANALGWTRGMREEHQQSAGADRVRRGMGAGSDRGAGLSDREAAPGRCGVEHARGADRAETIAEL